MSEDSGMVTVALCSEDINDETAATVIERLTAEDSVMRYRIFEDKEAAIEAVKKAGLNQTCDINENWFEDNKIKEMFFERLNILKKSI